MKFTKVNVAAALILLALIGTAGYWLGQRADRTKLPDLSKAFPDEKLISQQEAQYTKIYGYETNLSYTELKGKLVAYLGDGWFQDLRAPDLKTIHGDISGGGCMVEGYSMFKNDRFPGAVITLMHSRTTFFGNQFMAMLALASVPEAKPQ